MLKDDVLFIFLDESGNFDFSSAGSKFWSLTALCTVEPIIGREVLLALLYELAAAGRGQECFHATEDLQSVRDAVFNCINHFDEAFEIHSVIAEKRKTNPAVYAEQVLRSGEWVEQTNPDRLHQIVGKTLLQYIFRRRKFRHAKRIVVVLSSIFNKPRHRAIEKTLRVYLTNRTSVPFFIYFHATKADLNCQIADYCGWAISKKWEKNDFRSYELIKHHIQSEFPIFEVGTTIYY